MDPGNRSRDDTCSVVSGAVQAASAAILMLLFFMPAPATAHTRSESYSQWRAAGHELSGVFLVDAHRVTQLATSPADAADPPVLLARHLGGTIRADQGGASCQPAPPVPLSSETGQLRVQLIFTCPQVLARQPATLQVTAFRSVSPDHVHYVRLESAGQPAHEAVIAGARTTVEVGGAPKPLPSSFLSFVSLGARHVLSGLDHMAFLVAIVLLAGTPWRAGVAATGFTLGHSITLGLVAIDRLRPDAAAIEALIGFTIAYAAAEVLGGHQFASNTRPRWPAFATAAAIAVLPFAVGLIGGSSPPWPIYAGAALFTACFGAGVRASFGGIGATRRVAPALATAFGLVHGAGFAGGLLELKLPPGRMLTALLGFNVGVEAGQLVALAACAAIALAARGAPLEYRVLGHDLAAAMLLGLGVYWFVARSVL